MASTTNNVLNADANIYDDGYLRVEHDNFYVACAGQRVHLSRTEFLLFSRLARNPERIIRSEELWHYAWGDDKPFNSESFRVFMHHLRNRFKPFGIQIETLVSVGYSLTPRITPEARTG